MTTSKSDTDATGNPAGDSPDRLFYLSDPWLDAANAAVAALESLGSDLVVGISVVGGPQGDRSYHMSLGTDPVSIGAGTQNAGVTLTMSWSRAVAIATGHVSAQRSFLDGEIQLGGDAGKLLGHQKPLAELDDCLAEVRSRTDFGDEPRST